MKKLILSWLFILPLFIQAQTVTATFTLPDTLVGRKTVEAMIKAAIKPTVPPVVIPPIIAMDSCTKGPFITGISKIISTGATLNFDALNVRGINYQVLSESGSLLYSDSLQNLQSSSVPFKYPTLSNGSYYLHISGRTCLSKPDQRKFTVKTDAGEVVIPPPIGSTGTTIAKRIVSGLPDNMNLYAVKSGNGWLLSDSADFSPQPGRIFWYGINNHIIKQSQPLKNYPWPSNTPLQVWKSQANTNLTTLLKWSETVGMYDPDAASPFNYNDSYPFATFYFQPADSAYKANLQIAHWMDFEPDMKLPPGQVWVMPIGDIDTPEFLLRKGPTHFSKYQVSGRPYEGQLRSAGLIYDEVPKTPEQFNLNRGTGVSNWVPKQRDANGNYILDENGNPKPVPWPGCWNEMFFGPLRPGQTEPLSYQEGYDAGKAYSVASPVVVFENTEQDHAIGSQWPFVGGFYDAWMPRMEAEWLPKGIKPVVAHNYFTGFDGEGYTLGYGGIEANRWILANDVEKWPYTNLIRGGTLSKTTAVCYGYYLKSPDATRDEAYKFIFASQVAKKAGKDLLLFPQAMHEDKPNNYIEIRYPDGKFYLRAKQKHNPAELITISFLAQCFGKGVIPFGASPKTDQNFKFLAEFHAPENNLWKQNGLGGYEIAGPSFKYYVNNGGETFPAGSFEYGLAEGVRMYVSTFAKVKGGTSQFLKYRIDGGEWINPVNLGFDDLVFAFYKKAPIVYSETKDGITAVMYLHPYADTSLHKLEYVLNGTQFSMSVHSTIVHSVIHNL